MKWEFPLLVINNLMQGPFFYEFAGLLLKYGMCGRLVCSSPVKHIAEQFRVSREFPEYQPNYNVSPTEQVLIIRKDGEKQLVSSRWGFVPSWSKDLSVGAKMINARAETVSTKEAFRSAFRLNRCLIVADGFYEWEKSGKKRVPVYITLRSGKPFGIAGLYNTWKAPEGREVCTCTLITAEPNDLLGQIHNRMPVIVPEERNDFWLDPKNRDYEGLQTMLKPYPSEEMQYLRVSGKVNMAGYNSPDNIRPIADESITSLL
jgi:putative SOS response-associated peptidase YedK